MELDYGAHSLQGKKQRPNEDRYRLLGSRVSLVARQARGELFAVFDGIGGAPRGRDGAALLCDTLIEFYRQPEATAQALHALLKAANNTVFSWGLMANSNRPLGGCAGTVALFDQSRLTLFHAGDTVGYLLRDTMLQQLTLEHGDGRSLTNYFGIGAPLYLETLQLLLQDEDVVLLATDGLTKGLGKQAITETINHWLQADCQRAATELCLVARRNGATDDITAVVVEVVDLA